MPDETVFGFLESSFARIIGEEPYRHWSREQLYDNLDLVWGRLEQAYWEHAAAPRQQSWNNNNGYFYEKKVLDYLNETLRDRGVIVYNLGKRDYHRMPKEIWRELSRNFRVMLPRRCTNERFPIDMKIELDLLAIDTASTKIISSLSCKTRYRERVYQPLYAARHFFNIRSVFVTMDRDQDLKTCEKPSQKRALLESFMDRVFVNSSYEGLGFCSVVRPFSDIVSTLMEWKEAEVHG